jgi:hypothetical protein
VVAIHPDRDVIILTFSNGMINWYLMIWTLQKCALSSLSVTPLDLLHMFLISHSYYH